MFSLATADFNGDGNLDLVVNGHYILLGKGDGTFTVGTPAPNVVGTNAQVADFNGDGHAYIVVFSEDSDFTVLLGNGDGSFTNGRFSGAPLELVFSSQLVTSTATEYPTSRLLAASGWACRSCWAMVMAHSPPDLPILTAWVRMPKALQLVTLMATAKQTLPFPTC